MSVSAWAGWAEQGKRALFLGLSMVPWCVAAAAADQVTLRMEIYGPAGVPVMSLNTRLEESPNSYRIVVDYATGGMARVFVDLRTHAEAQGRLTPTATAPVSFRNESRRNGVDRHLHVDYKPDGTVENSSTPPLPQPLTPGEIRGTVDNLTAYLRLERQLARTGSCAMSVAVFDGRHRYDLQFTDAGRPTLTPTGGQNFKGETIACHMRRIEHGIPNDEQSEGASAGTMWYARLLPGDVMIPVRMQLDTQLGSVDAFLAELHGGGANLSLMR